MNPEHIGLQIKYYRQITGLTQKQLAEKIGTTWEMVSRYETGKSLPFRRILEIADSLKVPVGTLISDNAVGEKKAAYNFNSVPLVDKPFIDIKKAIENTKTYYNAPDWVARSSGKPFAISTEILVVETGHISKNGILYAVREKPSSYNDLIILHRGKEVVVTQYGSATSAHKICATVIAYEKRFR